DCDQARVSGRLRSAQGPMKPASRLAQASSDLERSVGGLIPGLGRSHEQLALLLRLHLEGDASVAVGLPDNRADADARQADLGSLEPLAIRAHYGDAYRAHALGTGEAAHRDLQPRQ